MEKKWIPLSKDLGLMVRGLGCRLLGFRLSRDFPLSWPGPVRVSESDGGFSETTDARV